MWPRFGIKIGNSTLCIAHVKADGKIEVIANKQGDRVSQACLLWNGEDEMECGLTAQQKMSSKPKQAVANSFELFLNGENLDDDKLKLAKQRIPCEYDELSHNFQLKCTIYTDDNDKVTTKQISPFDVHVALFCAELELAHQFYNNNNNNNNNNTNEKPIVVVSIPSYYNEKIWPKLAQAATEAGFFVARVIAEPTAAVLGYAIDELYDCDIKYLLAIKCGGLFSHFSFFVIRNGLLTRLAEYGPFNMGGQQHTEALVRFICDEFQRKYKLDPYESKRSMAKIQTAATNCKHTLTTLPSTQIYIDSLMDGIDFNVQMSRARFESLIQVHLQNFMQKLNECVDSAKAQHPDLKQIDEIILLGAPMQIPKLQSTIAAKYPDAKLRTTIAADEVVAVGCARQAKLLEDPKKQILCATEECLALADDIFIWHGKHPKHAKLLLKKGTILPASVELEIKKCSDNIIADTGDTDIVNTDLFCLRAGNKVIEALLKKDSSSKDNSDSDVFKLECQVNYKEEGGVEKPFIYLSYT